MADLMPGGNDDRVGLSMRKYKEQKVYEKGFRSGPPSVFSGPLFHASLGRKGILSGCSRSRDQSAAGFSNYWLAALKVG